MAKYNHYYANAVEIKGKICKCSPEVAAFINRRNWVEEYGVPARTYSYRRAKLEKKLRNMILKEQGRRAATRAETYR